MKQVIIINDSLMLPKGKLAAQVAHAAVASFLTATPELQRAWLEVGMPKIILSAADEQALIKYHQQATDAKLPTHLIRDAGKTVIEAGTMTCVGIGPAPKDEIDKITGDLKLVR